jgi:hypothetical protein
MDNNNTEQRYTKKNTPGYHETGIKYANELWNIGIQSGACSDSAGREKTHSNIMWVLKTFFTQDTLDEPQDTPGSVESEYQRIINSDEFAGLVDWYVNEYGGEGWSYTPGDELNPSTGDLFSDTSHYLPFTLADQFPVLREDHTELFNAVQDHLEREIILAAKLRHEIQQHAEKEDIRAAANDTPDTPGSIEEEFYKNHIK